MDSVERGLKRLQLLERRATILSNQQRVDIQRASQTFPPLDLTDAVTKLIKRQKSPGTSGTIDILDVPTPIFGPINRSQTPAETVFGGVLINNMGTPLLPRKTEKEVIPHEGTAEKRENEIVYENRLLRDAAVNGYTFAKPFIEREIIENGQEKRVAVDMHQILADIALDNTMHANPRNDTIELWVTKDKNNRPLPPSVNQQRMEYIGFRLGQLGRKPEDLFHFVQELLSDQRSIIDVTEIIRSSRTLDEFDAKVMEYRQNNGTNR